MITNKKIMAILFASGNDSKLSELTLHRTAASLPFGGRYRLIDFALSSLVNSGINRVGIITKNNYQSLMDHIQMGRDWGLNRKNSGIAVFPPFVLNTARDVYRGKIEALHTVSEYIEKSAEDYVVLGDCNIVANIDFNEVLKDHIKQKADITILCHNSYSTTSKRMLVVADENRKIKDLSFTELPSEEKRLISTNIYLASKKFLLEEISKANARAQFDFERDILLASYKDKFFNAYILDSFVAIIDDIKRYYYESMEMLNMKVRNEIFDEIKKVYTKVKDSVPTVYGEHGEVTNSLVADGCVIEGKVENSILFRNVHIGKGASVKNCIVMENGDIKEGAKLSYIITDKQVVVGEGRELAGFRTYPLVIAKAKIV